MRFIDILNKIANGGKVPNFKYKDDRFSQFNTSIHNDTDGKWVEVKTGIDDWEKIGYSFLNDEVEIIEEDKPKTLNDIRESYGLPRIEDKKIEKYNTGLDNGNWNEESVKKGILENNNIEDYLIRVMKDVDNIKFKTFEIIDYLNKENK